MRKEKLACEEKGMAQIANVYYWKKKESFLRLLVLSIYEHIDGPARPWLGY